MPKAVFSIRLEKDDIQFITAYAERLGLQRTVFAQRILEERVAVMRSEGLPAPIKDAPSPEDTDFWRRYKQGMTDAETQH